MSVVSNNILAGASGQGGGGYEIERSLRFNDPDSSYLSRTPSSAGNRKTWTWSGWVKRCGNATLFDGIFGADLSTAQRNNINAFFWNDNSATHGSKFQIQDGNGAYLRTTMLFRDPGSWGHLLIVADTTLATANDRIKIYWNGVRITEFAENSLATNVPQNSDLGWNTSTLHVIGANKYNNTTESYLNGYLADVHFIDGQALAATDFGETDDNGVWQPKEFVETPVTHTAPVYNSTYGSDITTTEVAKTIDNDAATYGVPTGDFIGYTYSNTNDPIINIKWENTKGSAISIYIQPWVSGGAANAGTFASSGANSVTIAAGATLETTFTFPAGYDGYFRIYASGDGTNLRIYDVGGVARAFNSFHLPFTDNSSNAALGFDSSSKGLNRIETGSVSNGVPVLGSMTFTGHSNAQAANLRDNDLSTLSADGGGLNTSTNMGYDLLIPYKVRKIRTIGAPSNGGSTNDGVFNIQYSDDGSTWTTVTGSNTTHTIPAGLGKTNETTIDDNGAHRYWRLYYSSSTGTGGNIWLSSLDMFADDIGANNWFVNNLSVAAGAGNDSLVDTPTNGDPANDTGAGGEITGNYATLNPLYTRSSATFSDGNLKLASSTYYSSGVPTISLDNGKWYFEGQIITDGANGYSMIGVTTAPENETYSGGGGGNEEGFGWYSATGGLYPITGSYSSWAVGDVVSVAYDSVTRKTWLAKNGTWQNSGDPAAGTGSVATIPGTKTAYFSIATGTNGVVIANFGQRPFAYTAPSGYKCLCTTNLPEPTIADGSQYFDTKVWTGDGTGSRSFTGYAFSPDFAWVKTRSVGYTHVLWDAVRGAGVSKELQSDSTNAEGGASTNVSGYLSAFNSDGFSSTAGSSDNDYFNKSGTTYVGWAWDAGSSNTTIAAGSLNSSLYTQNSVYSGGTVTGATYSGYGWANAFDTNFGNAAAGNGPTNTTTIDLSSFSITANAGEIVLVFNTDVSSNTYWRFNGVTPTTSNTSMRQTGNGYEFTLTSATSLTGITLDGASQLTGVFVAGKRLIDSNVSITTPSIASTVRANPSAGFSIVSYSGVDTPSTNTVAHGLNVAPSVYIIKNRTSQSYLGWIFNTTVIDGSVDYLVLNSTNAKTDQGSPWSTLPTSSVFTLGANDGNTCDAGDDFIAYCFAPVEGYSAMGSYTGNGDPDGVFVHTGFKISWLMVKCSSASSTNWIVLDAARDVDNVVQKSLLANQSITEGSIDRLDFLSNGFKLRSTAGSLNASGATFIYLAFASNPFKTARAR